MPQAEALASLLEGKRFVARAIVRHDALDPHAQTGVVGDRGLEESYGASLFLILHHLAEGDAGCIVDTDVDELPSYPTGIALTGAIARDAMTDPIEFTELFDVDMDQLAGVFTLVAPHWFGRLQVSYPAKIQSAQDAADRGWRYPQLGRDLLAGVALTTQHLDLRTRG